MEAIMEKECTKCCQIKDIREFHKRKGGLYGKHAECKKCLCERVGKQKKEWTELKRQNRRDNEKERRKVVKFVIEYARKVGEESIDKDRFCEYRKHCADFIKRKARLFLNTAIQKGWLVKPGKCSKCPKTGIIHGHHPDYSDPLTVVWVCPRCHSQYEKKRIM